MALHYPAPDPNLKPIPSSGSVLSAMAELRNKTVKDLWKSVSRGPTDEELGKLVITWDMLRETKLTASPFSSCVNS